MTIKKRVKPKTEIKIGSAIKRLRIKKQLSQVDICEKAGINQPYLSSLENNAQNPSIEYLYKVAEALEVPIIYIFWEAVEKEDFPVKDQFKYNVLKASIDEIFKELFES